MLAIQQLASVKAVPFGGYSQAERQRIIMGQPELVEVIELDPSQVSSEHAAISMHSCFPCWLAGEYHHAESWWKFFLVANGFPLKLTRLIYITCIAHGTARPTDHSVTQDSCVAALNVKGNFMFESATHRSSLSPFLDTLQSHSLVKSS